MCTHDAFSHLRLILCRYSNVHSPPAPTHLHEHASAAHLGLLHAEKHL